MQSAALPASSVAAGSFVAVVVDGRRTLCLKVDRIGKEHVNHYLVALDPLDDRRCLGLIPLDPETETFRVEGVSFRFADGEDGRIPEVGDAFACPAGVFLKVLDDPRAQRLHTYVELATGLLRPRMERSVSRTLDWSLNRL